MTRPVSTSTRLLRGLRRRCPRCSTPVFRSWYTMAETCPGCGIRFEREEGYWVGAVTINTTVTLVSFAGLFLVLTLTTWPDVPWAWVMAITIGVNLLLPVVFHPVSKTLWSALETSWHPLEPREISEATTRVGNHPHS